MSLHKINCEICGRESQNYIKLKGVEGRAGTSDRFFCSQYCSVEFVVNGGNEG